MTTTLTINIRSQINRSQNIGRKLNKGKRKKKKNQIKEICRKNVYKDARDDYKRRRSGRHDKCVQMKIRIRKQMVKNEPKLLRKVDQQN